MCPLSTKDPTPSTHIETIDDFLGRRESRFFGEGYKRITQDIHGYEYHGERGLLTARAGVRYPTGWSSKGDVDQRPHLSTIDGLLISARAGEAYPGLLGPGGELALCWRQVKVKAGKAPTEAELADFPVTVRRVDGGTSPLAPGDRARLECRVAAMTLTWTVEAVARPADRSPELSPPFGGESLRRVSQFLTEITVAPSALTAEAVVHFEAEQRWRDRPVSMVDCFVVALQLGQTMLYELDGLDRRDSDTLWMRRTTIQHVAERPVPARPVPVRVELSDPRLARQGDGQWRMADIVTEFQGIRLGCAVAHRLP